MVGWGQIERGGRNESSATRGNSEAQHKGLINGVHVNGGNICICICICERELSFW